MPKFKVSIEGTEHEVEIDGVVTQEELAKSYLTRDQAEAIANDRAAKARKAAEQAAGGATKPLEEQLAAAKAREATLQRRMLEADLLEAAREVGVRGSLLKPPAAGASAPIVAMLGNLFGLDPESGSWALRSGEDFAATVKDGRVARITPQDFVKQWASDKSNAEFIESNPQRLPNGSAPKGAGAPSTVKITDAKSFLDNLEGIAKGTVTVEP